MFQALNKKLIVLYTATQDLKYFPLIFTFVNRFEDGQVRKCKLRVKNNVSKCVNYGMFVQKYKDSFLSASKTDLLRGYIIFLRCHRSTWCKTYKVTSNKWEVQNQHISLKPAFRESVCASVTRTQTLTLVTSKIQIPITDNPNFPAKGFCVVDPVC